MQPFFTAPLRSGMQLNPNAMTIEGDLINALVLSGVIPAEFQVEPQRMKFMRTARTDKGVHAARQVCWSGVFVPINISVRCIRIFSL